MKVFKITLTAVYNNDNINENYISDNVWKSMKKIDKGLALLNVDDIKEMKRPNQTIKTLIENIEIQEQDDLSLKDEHVEINITKKRNKK